MKPGLKFAGFALIISILLTNACSNEPYQTVKGTDYLTISEMIVSADTIKLGESVTISMKAKTSDGCFTTLQYVINSLGSNSTLYRAFGKFVDTGTCTGPILTNDTIVVFKPTLIGRYYFTANQIPHTPVRKDSVQVIN